MSSRLQAGSSRTHAKLVYSLRTSIHTVLRLSIKIYKLLREVFEGMRVSIATTLPGNSMLLNKSYQVAQVLVKEIQ
jgi:hypothetical protein